MIPHNAFLICTNLMRLATITRVRKWSQTVRLCLMKLIISQKLGMFVDCIHSLDSLNHLLIGRCPRGSGY
jgi:hypothetical protein